jgi:2-polyprenyl-3-methyl-5-hydroxy-6-metoxy-1,4-benzoquinol methylase
MDCRESEKITTKEFWEKRQEEESKDFNRNFIAYKHISDKLIKKYLKYDKNKTFIEIGCVPGRNMLYFAKEFGYKISGIDYSKHIDSINDKLASYGIKCNLYKGDFLEFNSSQKYDVVLSSGFVEHFTDAEVQFNKHVELLADDGVLIIDIPNFKYGQLFLRKLFGLRPQDGHNLDFMVPDLWRSLAEKHKLSILYCDYYRTFAFWLPPKYNFILRQMVRLINKSINTILDALGLGNIKSRWFSPFIVLIAKKSEVKKS